jgi:hypothetical protein
MVAHALSAVAVCGPRVHSRFAGMPRPPEARFDWAAFRAMVRARWPEARDAWHGAGGQFGAIVKLYRAGDNLIDVATFLCLCRALDLDPMTLLTLTHADERPAP